MPEVLMVIAPEVFRDEEYAEPRAVLEASGAAITVASTRRGTCRGKLGMTAEASLGCQDALDLTWDAVVFVGGAGAAVFFDDQYAHELATRTTLEGGVVAAICVAPSTLAHAGLLEGRSATSFPSRRDDLNEHGAIYTDEPVTVDGRIITGNGPEAATAFGAAVARALGLGPA